MTKMSMNKVSHAGFRRDLQRFIDALGAFEDGDAKRAVQLGTAWDFFNEMLHFHHTSEHNVVWPAFLALGVSRELLDQLDSEHDAMAAALEEAGKVIAALRETPTTAKATAAKHAMTTLKQVTEEHLAHEEAEVEQLTLDNSGSEAFKPVEKHFRSQPPAHSGAFFAWALDGADPDVVAALKDGIPAPVILILNGVFGRRYRKTVAPVWR